LGMGTGGGMGRRGSGMRERFGDEGGGTRLRIERFFLGWTGVGGTGRGGGWGGGMGGGVWDGEGGWGMGVWGWGVASWQRGWGSENRVCKIKECCFA
jgi:hypothetical protein